MCLILFVYIIILKIIKIIKSIKSIKTKSIKSNKSFKTNKYILKLHLYYIRFGSVNHGYLKVNTETES